MAWGLILIVWKVEKKMREIKFRGKTVTTDSWVYGHYAFVDGFHVIYEGTSNPVIIKLNTLGQYTGLKDKNGVEIYEGDVLEERYLDEIDTLKVFYFGSGFMVEQVYEPNADFNLDGCDINKLYVVGNIYKK